jgi:hypothetical protein
MVEIRCPDPERLGEVNMGIYIQKIPDQRVSKSPGSWSETQTEASQAMLKPWLLTIGSNAFTPVIGVPVQ